MSDGAAGFWSYVRDDDKSDGGRIVSLAARLQAEFRLQTSDTLTLFVDRNSLEWGDQWRLRIAEAIAGTTFFIPIITPSYFKSRACRDELFQFRREAARLGLEQLLMPVYWVTVPDLENSPNESADEAIQLVDEFQRVDLREVRLEDETSSAFRKAVSRLAQELASRAVKVTSTVEDAATLSDATVDLALLDEPGEAGTLDKLAASEAALSQMSVVMEEIGEQIKAVNAIVSTAAAQLAEQTNMKARLILTERMARALDPPTKRLQELGLQYATELAHADPGVHTLLDMVASGQTADSRATVLEYLAGLSGLREAAEDPLSQLEELIASTNEAAKFSRSLRAPLARMQTGLRSVFDGKGIIDEWGRRADEIARHLEDSGH